MQLLLRLRHRAATLAVLGIFMVAACAAVAVGITTTLRDIERQVDLTGELVYSNVRTISQAQRELLRLEVLLQTSAPGVQLRDQAELVDAETEEATSSYAPAGQSDRFAETARTNELAWTEEISGQVERLATSSPTAAPARQEVVRSIRALERSYEVLAARSESARRAQADQASAMTAGLVGGMRQTLVLVGVLFLLGVASAILGSVLVQRTNRQRRATLRNLEQLNEELSWYERIVQATDSPLVATDPQGNVTWVNDAFERSTEFRLDAIEGRLLDKVLSGPATDPAAVQRIHEAVSRGTPVRTELACYAADGREFWVSLDFSPLHNEDGALEGFFGVLTDITERHDAEELLEAARRAAETSATEKAGFLATMSHEIRTPLNAVLGLTDLLLLTDLDEEQRDYAETANQSGNHLLALINDVLDYSALESGRLGYVDEPFSMGDVLDETLTMFVANAEAKGLELRLRKSPDVPALLRGDAMRLRQVLVNVVGNAMKFTDSGSIVVECDVVGSPWGTRCEVVLQVRDTGIGIPQWRIPDLFRSFVRGDASTTRQYGGTGLGLAISRQLVEAMGGTIDLESDVGEGTTVTIRMVHERVEEAAPAVPRAAQAILDHSERRVLVAEDDVVNQKVVVRMLGRIGVVPTVVENGLQAVEAVRSSAFDTVLMDVEMPVMDGLRAVRLIRDSDLPVQPWVVALTANALSGDRERFLAGGMDDYVSKPVTLDALTAALDRSRAGHAG